MDMRKVVLFDIDYTLFDTDTFKKSGLEMYALYEEVIPVLVEIGKIAKLGIFSEGDEDFQQTKLIKTNLQKYFPKEYIHIAQKKTDILEKMLKEYTDQQLFLVDDKLPVLYDASRKRPGLYTIWIKRGKYATVQQEIAGFIPNATILNLKEIIPIITGI